MSDSTDRGSPGEVGVAFETTPWTMVLAARSDSAGRRVALERLCRTYWGPVYHYIRRRGWTPHDAEDLTQGFFAYVLEDDFFDRPDPSRGRFRGYLVGALKRYLADVREHASAKKRGGGAQWIDWHSPEAETRLSELGDHPLDPSAAYEKSWALTLLGRALQRLGDEQAAAGRAAIFATLMPHLTSPAGPGDYDRLAGTLGIRRPAVAVAVHRLKQRYSELVRLEVAATVADPTEVKAEMAHLLQALRL